MTLGDLIKKYREDNKLSMSESAAKSGLSKAYTSLLEKIKIQKQEKKLRHLLILSKRFQMQSG